MSYARLPRISQAGLLLALAFVTSSARADQQDNLRFFETRIRPLLHERCVRCHGESQQKGGLRLDSLEAIRKGGESGQAAVPHKPAESLLLEAVRYESFEMPPEKPLSDGQIASLEKWIADGMVWPVSDGKSVRLTGAAFTTEEREFWSLQPIQHPDPPSMPDWGVNAIDAFIARGLQQKSIEGGSGC